MKTVHIILNAHLDPIWLWPWQDGLDEVLNTSFYICGLLDRHPDTIYTRGEAWLYEQIRTIDPKLFRRVLAHVQAGRWSVVGGWYLQPDCNLPSGFALRRQIGLGKQWFKRWLGRFPTIAYNVDSFGHAASLPGMMRQAGQRAYVMMRPQEHEMQLPARLFRWRGYVDGPEVVTFRIASAYCTPEGLTEEHITASLSELPPGIDHTMCFVGIGDHGGGPTEAMIDWVRSHQEAFRGVRLVFSSPERFFQAVRRDHSRLPVVTGELQQHAVGCYTVHRPVKVALRRAEHRLVQAEMMFAGKAVPPAIKKELHTAWARVCFHHFHDTLGGTCLPSAYADVEAELGQASAIAGQIASTELRRRLIALPNDPHQRLVVYNASEFAYDDYVEVEPWLEWTRWQPQWQLFDENNEVVPYQMITPESGGAAETRLLFALDVKPGALRVLRIANGSSTIMKAKFAYGPDEMRLPKGPALSLHATGKLRLPGAPALSLPHLILCDDPTDTWSHGIDRYERTNQKEAVWEPAQSVDRGPLMGSLVQRGHIGASKLQAEWRIYQGKPWIELLLRVVWNEEHRVLKLDWHFDKNIVRREDGIPDGSLVRPLDGKELPLRDWTSLYWGRGGLAILAPDVFALDCTPKRLGLTLLRSCVMACHDPNPGTHPRAVFSDRGEHFFRFRFLGTTGLTAAMLDAAAFAQQRPLLTASITRGMATRGLRGAYSPSPAGEYSL